ncbi:MAG: c-type cytochrome [Bdellovibrio bacteriovorus]
MNRRDLGRLALLAALAASPQVQAESSQAEAVQRGTAHYLFFCGNCHGVDGKGDGPLAVHLKMAPTDLTRLAADDGGANLAERVMKALDGRHAIGETEAHRMPIFSESLEVKTVIEITEYLKTIQQ